jgi:peptidoglycan/xylan/chitin deacetylase (PgdA/CDA1 family)
MHPLALIKNRFLMRSVPLSLQRTAHIASRYGMDNQRLRSSIWEYAALCNARGFTPTFPVTATVLKRSPSLFKDIMQRHQVEFAVHGYRHIDYSSAPVSTFKEHLGEALRIFKECRIPVSGFRFPFLRGTDALVRVLPSYGFNWDSSRPFFWSMPDIRSVSQDRRQAFLRIGASYQSAFSVSETPVPESRQGFCEIPVSMPDDDMLLERLGLPPERIHAVTANMLKQVRAAEGILVLQLHPERFPFFKRALTGLMRSIQEDETVWPASLGEVSRWWAEKNASRWSLESRRGRFRLFVEAGDRVRVLARTAPPVRNLKPHGGDWTVLPGKAWTFESRKKPVVGVHPSTASRFLEFLQNEGWFYEVSSQKDAYSVYLNGHWTPEGTIGESFHRVVLATTFPLLRFAKWPEARKCCVAVSGDIDAVDIQDYLVRYHD